MTLAHPLALLGLALAPLTVVVARNRLRRLPGRRGVVVLTVRCLLLALLVMALAGPALLRPYERLSVVFAVDTSARVPAAQRAAARAWLAAALRRLGPDDTAALLTFGAAPSSLTPLETGPRAAAPPVLPSSRPTALGTDYGAALRAALGTLGTDGSGRIVVLGDGRETVGDARAAALLAAARRVGVVAVPLAPPRRDDVAVVRVGTPTRARAGARAAVVVALHSTYTTTATLSVWSDDALAGQQQVPLTPGTTSFSLDVGLSKEGFHTLTARVAAPGDAIAENNALAAPVVVLPPARVLLVTTSASASAGLVGLLQSQGLRVRVSDPGALPVTASGLRPYDGIVLHDVPAAALGASRTAALRSAVYDGGRGLLVVGGRHAYSLGRYSHTPLEELLPVWSIPPARLAAGHLALMLVLDKSGSMDETQNGVTKMAMVREAATKTLSHLHPDDSLGVLAFDDSNHWIYPLHRVSGEADKAAASHRIAGLSADGNTLIYPALKAAFDALGRTKVAARHIVLLTDGQGEDANFERLIRQIRQAGITLSTIAVGSDASTDQLRRFASLGGGRFYFTADPRRIPSIFILETRLSGGPPIVEGTLGVKRLSDSALVRSLVGLRLPALNGYGMTIPKDAADVVLQSTLNDPVLTSWQFGLGRVAAWAADWGPRWAGRWLTLPAAPRLWDDMVRWTLPAPPQSALHPTAGMEGDALVITASPRDAAGAPLNLLGDLRVHLRGPGGLDTLLPLEQDAPGHYQVRLPHPRPGSYAAEVARYDGPVALAPTTLGAAVPYPLDYGVGGGDPALLSDITTLTGGVVTDDAAQAVSAAGTGPRPPVRQRPLPLTEGCLLLGLLLLPVDVGLRILLNTPAAYRPRPRRSA